ncbi:hypothetical protein E2C01_007185 [Portunus trituberculatus]|uniref:Uncharacterized protein n=1 Tax=Portunus trituberculatus TaxID=210409 RepID=A0A5B7CYH5_PORTR|nr:hypothetical protein [Portunus trituberculatus]
MGHKSHEVMDFTSRVLPRKEATFPPTPGLLVHIKGQGQAKTLKRSRGSDSGIPINPLVTYKGQHPHGSPGRLPKVRVITFFVGAAMGVSFGTAALRRPVMAHGDQQVTSGTRGLALSAASPEKVWAAADSRCFTAGKSEESPVTGLE